MTTTLVVDGNNILMRSIKAAEHRMQLSADHGGHEVNTAPLLLFINMLGKYVRRVRPDKMVVCWDGGRSAHRVAVYADYKSNRADRNEEKDDTPFALAKQFLTLANIQHVEVADVEADDLVAAYVLRRVEDEQVVILSADKDFLQLIQSKHVVQIRPGGGPTPESEEWTHVRIFEEKGCFPHDIPAVMALTGDSGDGVPGIPGFGEKTACKFLAKYDWDLDRLLTSGEAKIAGHEDDIRRNLALVDLCKPLPGVYVPPAPAFNPTEPSSITYRDLVNWLDEYAMSSITDRLATRTLWR